MKSSFFFMGAGRGLIVMIFCTPLGKCQISLFYFDDDSLEMFKYVRNWELFVSQLVIPM